MTGALTLPANLVDSAAGDPHDRRRAWMERLPGIVGDLARRWELRPGAPYQPGGQTAWVAPARTAHGRDLVLKIGWRHPESDHEADGLRLWAGRGTVLLHAAEQTEETSALLIERCATGRDLTQEPVEQQDEVVAGLLRRLWVQPPAGHPIRPLAVMCDGWADEYEADPDPRLDPGVARAGIELFRTLPTTADRQVALLTDLHAGNVLGAEREPWLVIDPKPYVGDPAYDPLQHLLNCPERLAADPHVLDGRPVRRRPRAPAAVAVRPVRGGVVLDRPGGRRDAARSLARALGEAGERDAAAAPERRGDGGIP